MTGAARRWLELSVRSPSAGERGALLAEGLMVLGGRAAEERSGWYVTYVPDPGDLDAFGARALASLADETGIDDLQLRFAWQEQEDWAETWKRGLDVRRITDRIVVRPSWIDYTPTGPDEIVIVLDPGMAFGTAEHGTTRGCLRLLDGRVRAGDRILDVGAGSGILSVAAAALGASEVIAIEGDELACEAMRENVASNGAAAAVRVVEAWATDEMLRGYHPVSGIVANIETGILAPLYAGMLAAIEPGGWLIVSGVLDHEWGGVGETLRQRGCDLLGKDEDGEWRSGVFTLPS